MYTGVFTIRCFLFEFFSLQLNFKKVFLDHFKDRISTLKSFKYWYAIDTGSFFISAYVSLT